MKLSKCIGAAMVSLVLSGAAWADDHCNDAVADWQPREVLRKQIEQHGSTVQRIKVDDGCYEVRGVDKLGNSFKAKYAPASLRIRKLEIKFEQGGDIAQYLNPNPAPKSK